MLSSFFVLMLARFPPAQFPKDGKIEFYGADRCAAARVESWKC
jgi:hypothetical protein